MHGYGQVVYDGLGNPVGLLPGLLSLFNRGGGQQPPLPPSLLAALPMLARANMPFRRFAPPVGWVTPALPYTGRQPRRVYLRCSAWPGPSGMVPAYAVQPGGAPGVPGAPGSPGTPGMPGMPGGGRRGRRMRRFRRR
jgi:hypothetical protein